MLVARTARRLLRTGYGRNRLVANVANDVSGSVRGPLRGLAAARRARRRTVPLAALQPATAAGR
ncbi:MAG: hypothetical protein DCC67_16675, partial [Planctomycetota bacterium]